MASLTPEQRTSRSRKRLLRRAGSHALAAGVALSLAGNALQNRQVTKARERERTAATSLEALRVERSKLAGELRDAKRGLGQHEPLSRGWQSAEPHMQGLLDFERDALDLTRVARRRSLTEAELIRAGLALGSLHASSAFYSSSPVQGISRTPVG